MLTKSEHLKSIEQDREDLASAIRLAAYFNMHEGICNHFSVQCEGPEELYLINAYGWHWTEVTAIGVDQIEFLGPFTLHRKMVANTLMQIEISGQPNGRSQVFTVGLDGFQMVSTVQHGNILSGRVICRLAIPQAVDNHNFVD